MNFDLINEIGHELKNKLGIIGNFLSEIASEVQTDTDFYQDTSFVYEQLVLLAKILSELNYEDEKEKTETYILRILKEFINHRSSNIGETKHGTLTVRSKDFSASEQVHLQKNNSSTLSFIDRPRTGMEKIVGLSLRQIANGKHVEVVVVNEEQGEEVVEVGKG